MIFREIYLEIKTRWPTKFMGARKSMKDIDTDMK